MNSGKENYSWNNPFVFLTKFLNLSGWKDLLFLVMGHVKLLNGRWKDYSKYNLLKKVFYFERRLMLSLNGWWKDNSKYKIQFAILSAGLNWVWMGANEFSFGSCDPSDWRITNVICIRKYIRVTYKSKGKLIMAAM